MELLNTFLKLTKFLVTCPSQVEWPDFIISGNIITKSGHFSIPEYGSATQATLGSLPFQSGPLDPHSGQCAGMEIWSQNWSRNLVTNLVKISLLRSVCIPISRANSCRTRKSTPTSGGSPQFCRYKNWSQISLIWSQMALIWSQLLSDDAHHQILLLDRQPECEFWQAVVKGRVARLSVCLTKIGRLFIQTGD